MTADNNYQRNNSIGNLRHGLIHGHPSSLLQLCGSRFCNPYKRRCIDGGDTAKRPHRTEYAKAYDAGRFGHKMIGLETYTGIPV